MNLPLFFLFFPLFLLHFFLGSSLTPALCEQPGGLLCIRCASCQLPCGSDWWRICQQHKLKKGVEPLEIHLTYQQNEVSMRSLTFVFVITLLPRGVHFYGRLVSSVRRLTLVHSEVLVKLFTFARLAFRGFRAAIFLRLERWV